MNKDINNTANLNLDGLSFFRKNSKAYADSESHKSGDDLSVLVERLPAGDGMNALDVATGTGFTAFRLAQTYKLVVGLDVTGEMMEEARKISTEKKLDNILYVLGRSEKMPFLDHTFDVVTCRRAAHHFTDREGFIREVRRVLRPGGTFGFVDMVSPADDINDSFNELERLRDPTHLFAGSKMFWENAVSKAGFTITFSQILSERISFKKWLSPVSPEDDSGIKCRIYLNNNENLKKILSFHDDTMIKTRLVLTATCSDKNES